MVKTGFWIAVSATVVQLWGCSGKASRTNNDEGDSSDAATSASDATSSSGSGTPGPTGSGGSGDSGVVSSSAADSGGAATTSASSSGGDGGAATSAETTSTGGNAGSGGVGGGGGNGGDTASCIEPTGAAACVEGEFCDLPSACGAAAEPLGVCAPRPAYEDCEDVAEPVCGCEGQTYTNDCQRRAAGMLKAYDGVCEGDGFRSYPTSYLVWRATDEDGGSGPAAVLSATQGLLYSWADASSFSPEDPPSDAVATALAQDDFDSLFLRAAGIRASDLPHDPEATGACRATLYYRLCKGCGINTVTYGDPASVSPELEPLWSWFDSVLGEADPSNPRNYCN